MSCKGIPDERSRLATILIIPLLNCLAKVPLYVLLINIYFAQQKGLAMFFISTISLLMVLPVSKILTMTVLKDKETTPFVMEMPPYHLPTIRGVVGRALERVWLFLRKITTIVAAGGRGSVRAAPVPRIEFRATGRLYGQERPGPGCLFKKPERNRVRRPDHRGKHHGSGHLLGRIQDGQDDRRGPGGIRGLEKEF